MKKVIVIILILIGLVVAGAGIFIATFDANKYRPMIIQKIEDATGKKISLDHVAIVWKNGIALQVRTFKIYPGTSMNAKPAAEFESVTAVVRLMPLLQKDVQITSVIISKPRLDVDKTADGLISVAGMNSTTQGASKNSQASGGPAISLVIDRIEIKDGEVDFHDRTRQTPVNLNIKDLDVTVKNFSQAAPFSFEVRATVLSEKQNIFMNGEFQLPQKDEAGLLRNFTAKFDLDSLNVSELMRLFPALRASGIQDKISGQLQVNVDELDLDPRAIKSAKAALNLREGKVSLKQLRSPVDHLNADLAYQNQKLEVRDISCRLAEGNVKISGVVDQPMARALSDIQASFQGLSLAELMPAADGAAGLTGRLSADIQGKAAGTQWTQISQSLSGQGRLTLQDGVMLNYNILRVVIEKIASVPGIGETLVSNFPQEFRSHLDQPSTIFKPLEFPFTVSDGAVAFQNIVLATDLFEMSGSGRVGFDRSINSNVALQMNPVFSQALIKSAAQVELLSNPKGQIEIPLTIQGLIPSMVVLPDIQNLTTRIATAKTQEVVTNLINKPGEGGGLEGLLGKKTSAADTASSSAAPGNSAPTETKDNSVAGLLGKALKE